MSDKRLKKALAYVNKGKKDKAEAIYSELLLEDPENVEVRDRLAHLMKNSGNFMGAAGHFAALCEQWPEIAGYRFNLAQSQAGMGNVSEAEVNYRITTRLAPSDFHMRFTFALFLQEHRSFFAALKEYDAVLSINPNAWTVHNNVGNIFQEFSEEYEKAENHLRKAVELNPEYAQGYSNLGNVLRKMKRYAEAQQVYEKSVELEPENPIAHYNLALVLEDQDAIDEAIAEYRNVLRLDASFVRANQRLQGLGVHD